MAAHIQNSLEEVQYIDGVSSAEDSDSEDKPAEAAEDKEKSDSSEEIVDTFRVIGLRRKKGESLVSFQADCVQGAVCRNSLTFCGDRNPQI